MAIGTNMKPHRQVGAKTHTHTHTHTHNTHTHTHTHSLAHTHHTHTHTHSLTRSHTPHTHSLTHSHSHTDTISFFPCTHTSTQMKRACTADLKMTGVWPGTLNDVPGDALSPPSTSERCRQQQQRHCHDMNMT